MADEMIEGLLARVTQRINEGRRFPEATYRLQFHAGFTFRDACRVVPYLRELGVTHCYASPYLKARPGSTHGYDITDHRVLNPEIGSDEDHAGWVKTVREYGLRRSWTWSPITWGSWATRIPGGTTCWRTVLPLPMAATSTLPGMPHPGLSCKVGC